MATSPPKKRPRMSLTPPPPSPIPAFHEEEETTDLKLALLSSLHPTTATSTLLEHLLASNGSVSAATSLLRQRRAPTHQSTLSSFVSQSLPRPPKSGDTLHLHSPTHIATLTATTLHHGFLPADLATALLTDLLAASSSFSPPPEFSLFGRAVTSPHTMCLYTHGAGHGHTYQGDAAPTRAFTPTMRNVVALVETHVNAELLTRARQYGQLPSGQWRANAAYVNCYRGGEQAVGWHSDQLTYLGPAAVIASLSLGCAREFRIRRVCEKEGAYALWLPHNSLLLMNPGMQEEWKHSVVPTKTLGRHSIAGDVRINVTFRCYRDSLKPEFTPRCKCKEPAILKPVFGPVKEGGEGKERRYFWTCGQEYRVGGLRCGFFDWAVFDKNGEPPWSAEFLGDEPEAREGVLKEKNKWNWEKWPEDEKEEWENDREDKEEGSLEDSPDGDGKQLYEELELETNEQTSERGEESESEWSDETLEGSERSERSVIDWDEQEPEYQNEQESPREVDFPLSDTL